MDHRFKFVTTCILLIFTTTAHADCRWLSADGSIGTAHDLEAAITAAPAGQHTKIQCADKKTTSMYEIEKDKSGDRSTIIGRLKKEAPNG
ncbi:MAG: hypothetical protein AB7I29_14915 [Geobacter sp.]